jgi:hypothetical protein
MKVCSVTVVATLLLLHDLIFFTFITYLQSVVGSLTSLKESCPHLATQVHAAAHLYLVFVSFIREVDC